MAQPISKQNPGKPRQFHLTFQEILIQCRILFTKTKSTNIIKKCSCILLIILQKNMQTSKNVCWMPRFSMPGDRLDRLLCQWITQRMTKRTFAWRPGVCGKDQTWNHPYPRRIQLYDDHWISNRFVSAIFLFFSYVLLKYDSAMSFFFWEKVQSFRKGGQSKTKRIWLFWEYEYICIYHTYLNIYPLNTFLKQLLALFHTEGLGVTHWDSDVHSFTVWELKAKMF